MFKKIMIFFLLMFSTSVFAETSDFVFPEGTAGNMWVASSPCIIKARILHDPTPDTSNFDPMVPTFNDQYSEEKINPFIRVNIEVLKRSGSCTYFNNSPYNIAINIPNNAKNKKLEKNEEIEIKYNPNGIDLQTICHKLPKIDIDIKSIRKP